MLSAKNSILQYSSKTVNDFAQFKREVSQSIELMLFDIPDIERSIKMRSNFAARTFGDRKELMEFLTLAAFKTFCDVGHNRDRS